MTGVGVIVAALFLLCGICLTFYVGMLHGQNILLETVSNKIDATYSIFDSILNDTHNTILTSVFGLIIGMIVCVEFFPYIVCMGILLCFAIKIPIILLNSN